MELIQGYLDKFKFPIKKERTLTKEQSLAEEIWLHFSKKPKFGMLMGIIKKQGDRAVREIYHETIKSDHPDHWKLFLWKIGKNKIVWYP